MPKTSTPAQLKRDNRTNIAFVRDLMEYSNHGALAQLFVCDALDKWATKIAATDPAQLDNGFISGAAWQAVAKEIKTKIEARYASTN